jgi:glycosidase
MRFSPKGRRLLGTIGAVGIVAALGIALGAAGATDRIPRTASSGEAPAITRIDPPNWWAGLTPRLMLLVYGHDLGGATIACRYPGVRVARSRVTDGGNYLFAWLRLGPNARPGAVPCRVRTAGGETIVHYRLNARVNPSGKFQGLTPSDVLYLIMVDRFADGDTANDHVASMPGTFDRSAPRAYHGGDLRGIEDHLGYLRKLGVTALWLTPIVANDPRSARDYHGYSAYDEYEVNPHFGTLRSLRRLVRAAHRDGIKVLLDMVVNDVGPKNPWVARPPEPDWFHGTPERHAAASSAFQYLADPHATRRERRDVVDGWFANILPDMNLTNPDAARYFIQVSVWWAEQTGIDGFRLDTFPYVSRGFWERYNGALHRLFPRLFTIGEVFNADPEVTSFFAGGRRGFDGIDTGVNTVFDYPLYFALRAVLLRHAPVREMIHVLAQDRLYPHPGVLVPFLGNHDVPRFASAPGSSAARLELAQSIVLTMRGIPQLYYGDEIGMTGGNDPDNRHDFPGGFPGDPRDAFTAGGRTPAQQAIFAHVERLLRVRKENPALRGGRLWDIAWSRECFAYARVSAGERVLAVFNAGRRTHSLAIAFGATPLSGTKTLTPLLSGATVAVKDDKVKITLPAAGFALYRAQ